MAAAVKRLEKEVKEKEKERDASGKALQAAQLSSVDYQQELEQLAAGQRANVLGHVSGTFHSPHELLPGLPAPGPADWGPGELLRLYDTCHAFHKALSLTPFALEDLAAALTCDSGDTTLVAAIGVALLKAILSPVRAGPSGGGSLAGAGAAGRRSAAVRLLAEPINLSGGAESLSAAAVPGGAPAAEALELLPHQPDPGVVSALTWQSVLAHVLLRSSVAEALLDTQPLPGGMSAAAGARTLWADHLSRAGALRAGLLALRTTEFHALAVEQKLALLGTLGLQSFESGALKAEMEERGEQRAQLQRDHVELERGERREAAAAKAALREVAVERLREERREDDEHRAAEAAAKAEAAKAKAEGGGAGSPGGGKSGSPKGGMDRPASSGSVKSLSSALADEAAPTKGGAKKKAAKATKDAADAMEEDAKEGGDGKEASDGKKKKKEWAPSFPNINKKVSAQSVLCCCSILG